jgi:hypothetical protein
MENIFGLKSYLLYPCSLKDSLSTEQQVEVLNFWKIKNLYELDCD